MDLVDWGGGGGGGRVQLSPLGLASRPNRCLYDLNPLPFDQGPWFVALPI